MSPELVQERPYDYTSDLWALGCILYELYAGQPPFYTNSIATLVKLVLKGHIKWPKGMSKPFRTFLQGLLEKDISQRLKWPDLLCHPFLKKHLNFDKMREIQMEGRQVANQRTHGEVVCRGGRGSKPQGRSEKSTPALEKSQSGPILTNKSYSTPVKYELSTAHPRTENQHATVNSSKRNPSTGDDDVKEKAGFNTVISENNSVKSNGELSNDLEIESLSKANILESEAELESPSVKTLEITDRNDSLNSTYEISPSKLDTSNSTPNQEIPDPTHTEQNTYTNSSVASNIKKSHSTHEQVVPPDERSEVSPLKSKSAVEISSLPQDKSSKKLNSDKTRRKSRPSPEGLPSDPERQSSAPLRTHPSSTPSSPLQLSPEPPQHESGRDERLISKLDKFRSKRFSSATDLTQLASRKLSSLLSQKQTPKHPRENPASEKPHSASAKQRLSGLKSHSLQDLLPSRADKDRDFSKFEAAVSRIDSLFRLLMRYLSSLDVSFPLLRAWAQFYQVLSPTPADASPPGADIMRDLERGWEGTELFLELTRDCLSKIRSESPRLRSRAGERLNKLLTFQILILVARETVPNSEMSEVVRRFGTEELCSVLMSSPVLLRENLCREQLAAVFLSHELFSLLTHCSTIQWSARVRRKLDSVTHMVTRSLPERRPPYPAPSSTQLLLAFYPLANALVQKRFSQLEGMDLDGFIDFNIRTLLETLPTQDFAPYVTTGYLDQVFVFLNSMLKEQRRNRTLLRLISFASRLFTLTCINRIADVTHTTPLGPILQPSLSPIALLEFLVLVRDCLLQMSRDSLSLQALSSDLVKELFVSVSALMHTRTLDRLMDWYTEWTFLEFYCQLVELCVKGLCYLLECCVDRGMNHWIDYRIAKVDTIASLLRIAQYLLIAQPDTDGLQPLLLILAFCARREELITHVAYTLQLPEWEDVPYSLFSHLIEETGREKELCLLLKVFLEVASLHHQQQHEDQMAPVLRLISDRHNSDLNLFYQLLAHENKEIARTVYELLGLLIDRSQDSQISDEIASQQRLIDACVRLLNSS